MKYTYIPQRKKFVLCMCSGPVAESTNSHTYQLSTVLKQDFSNVSVSILTGIRQCCVTRLRVSVNVGTLLYTHTQSDAHYTEMIQ